MSLAINQFSQSLRIGTKKIALAAALLLTVGLTTSFASPKDGDDAVTASFRKDFKKAEVMEKQAGKNYTKFTFKLDDVILFAFYNDHGQLLAVTRNIKSSQLPIQLLVQVRKDYPEYWISDLFELTSEGDSNYYITLENANTRVVLRSYDSGSWEVYNKKAKL
ncbi:MAG TPA: hypothetical protein VG605_14640 [Puia sp.]|nr:hypothetical protein [Puia sp.]